LEREGVTDTVPSWRKPLLIVLVLCSPWLFVQGWILVGAPTPDHTVMPACPDGTMNCASLSSQSNVRMDSGLSVVIDANISEVRDAWESWSAEQGLREVYASEATEGEYFAHRVAITPFWRFPDDVVVGFASQGEATEIALYSSSRLGQSDLGVNPDRLADLHQALVGAQASS
jgi:hypothetical protein